jgi:hypothetical protein
MLSTLTPSCVVVMKSGNFNFLEPSGLLQACNGTVLPFNELCQNDRSSYTLMRLLICKRKENTTCKQKQKVNGTFERKKLEIDA